MCQSLFLKKETLAQMFSCEFCEISKNTFFTGHLWATDSVQWIPLYPLYYHIGISLGTQRRAGS